MSFAACLTAASRNREVTQAEHDWLAGLFEKYLNDADGDEVAAGALLRDFMEVEAFEAQRRAFLTSQVRQKLWVEVHQYRNWRGQPDAGAFMEDLIDATGRVDTNTQMNTVKGTADAIMAEAMAMIDDSVARFLGDIATKQKNATQWRLVDLELQGRATGDATAKAMADSISGTLEMLRQRANAAGFHIPKLDGWGRPVHHDLRKVFQANERLAKATKDAKYASMSPMEAWRTFVKEHIDQSAMRHPNGKRGLSDSELDDGLAYAFDSITTVGSAHHNPSKMRATRGRSFHSRHSEERWLVWKDPEARLAYEKIFSSQQPFNTVLDHIQAMAHDTALFEVLGPDHAGTMAWLKQIAEHEAGKARANSGRGNPDPTAGTLMPKNTSFAISPMLSGITKLSDFEGYARGTTLRAEKAYLKMVGAAKPANYFIGDTVDTMKDLHMAAHLGGTAPLALMTDQVTSAVIRSYYRMPSHRALTGMLRNAHIGRNSQRIREARKAGAMLEAAVHATGGAARFVGDVGTRKWSAALTDRVLWVTGLKGVTQVAKDTTTQGLRLHLGELAAKSFDDLRGVDRDLLTTMRISRDDWQVIRGVGLDKVDGLPALNFTRIAQTNRDVGTRLFTGLSELTNSMTLTAGPRATSLLSDPRLERGSGWHTMARSIGYLMSFTLAHIQVIQLRAFETAWRRGTFHGGRYYAALIASTTAMGLAVIQFRNVTGQGMDPEPLVFEDGTLNTKLYWRALILGGGLGFYGDFINATVNAQGRSIGEARGGFITEGIDGFGVLVQDLGEFAAAEGGFDERMSDSDLGRDFLKVLRAWLPGNNAWFARLALDRMIFDQLQYIIDPETDQVHRQRMQTMREFYPETEYWWEEGAVTPSRPPAL